MLNNFLWKCSYIEYTERYSNKKSVYKHSNPSIYAILRQKFIFWNYTTQLWSCTFFDVETIWQYYHFYYLSKHFPGGTIKSSFISPREYYICKLFHKSQLHWKKIIITFLTKIIFSFAKSSIFFFSIQCYLKIIYAPEWL